MGPLTIGRIVQYQLTSFDAEQINRRRATKEATSADSWPKGAQAHTGNQVSEGQKFPMIITAVSSSETPSVNGQVFLDGNDTFWATSRKEGDEPGGWVWPQGTAQAAKAKAVADDQHDKLTPDTTSTAE